MNLHNKRILITGATGGLGQLLAQKLAEKGAILGLVGRDEGKLTALQANIHVVSGHAHLIKANLNAQNEAKMIVAEATQKMGGIDVLINNAGVLDFIAFEDQTEARIAEMIHTNVTALIQLTNAALPAMQAKNTGHFVLIGSIFGSLGFPHFATYCASKFAVHGFSQALRRELADTNIGVTYIAPRGIKTPMLQNNMRAMMTKAWQNLDAPEKVAQIIVNALENETQEVFIGQPQSFFAWLNGIAPKMVNMGLKKQTALAAPFLNKKS